MLDEKIAKELLGDENYFRNGILTIPNEYKGETITEVGSGVFFFFNGLTSVGMPNITHVGDFAFQSCNSLISVEMPNVTHVGTSAFCKCNNLTSVEIPNVTHIKKGTFYNCVKLTKVIMNKVIEIEEDAFCHCTAFGKDDESKFVIPNTVTRVEENAFTGWTNKQTIYWDKNEACNTDWMKNAPFTIKIKGEDNEYKELSFKDREAAEETKEDIWDKFVNKFSNKLNIAEYTVFIELPEKTFLEEFIKDIFKDVPGATEKEKLDMMKIVIEDTIESIKEIIIRARNKVTKILHIDKIENNYPITIQIKKEGVGSHFDPIMKRVEIQIGQTFGFTDARGKKMYEKLSDRVSGITKTLAHELTHAEVYYRLVEGKAFCVVGDELWGESRVG